MNNQGTASKRLIESKPEEFRVFEVAGNFKVRRRKRGNK